MPKLQHEEQGSGYVVKFTRRNSMAYIEKANEREREMEEEGREREGGRERETHAFAVVTPQTSNVLTRPCSRAAAFLAQVVKWRILVTQSKLIHEVIVRDRINLPSSFE